MLHSNNVNGNKQFELHVRTILSTLYGSIKIAALKVGDELSEIDIHKSPPCYIGICRVQAYLYSRF